MAQANEVIDNHLIESDFNSPADQLECLKGTLKILSIKAAKQKIRKENLDKRIALTNLQDEERKTNPSTEKITNLKQKIAEI